MKRIGSARWLAVAAALVGLALGGAAAALSLTPRDSKQDQSAAVPQAVRIAPTSAPTKVGARVGQQAPDFEAALLSESGGKLRLSDLRGKVVVLNFWASWCLPCRAEARDLEATYRRYKARGLLFLGVDIVQDTWEDAFEFVQEFRITYPTVRDSTGQITGTYQIVSLPTTYFIDRKGLIRGKYIGPFLGDAGKRELLRRIEAMLR